MRVLGLLINSCIVSPAWALAGAIPYGLREQDPGSDPYRETQPEDGREALPRRPEPVFPGRAHQRPTGFIALGDSYSAGIGTGANGTGDGCRRGFHAYPELVNHDLVSQEGPDSTTFQFLSCTGSTVEDVLLGSDVSQIAKFNTSTTADFALLSIGGNDLGFFDIMNSCIFRFYNFYSGTCEQALERSDKALASGEFESHLRLVIMEILDRLHWEKRPYFTVTVTGYARFFNDETDLCDDSSLSIWWRGPKLKRKLRRRMNEMVLAVNDKIRHSVEAVNAEFSVPKVMFVDYDAEFEGHRFCEPGVIEPDYSRNETWFFLVGGADNADGSAAEQHELLPLASPLTDPQVCLELAERSKDWGELALCMMARAVAHDPTLRPVNKHAVAMGGRWHAPTYYGQTFHPRAKGHEAIRDQIYRHWHQYLGH